MHMCVQVCNEITLNTLAYNLLLINLANLVFMLLLGLKLVDEKTEFRTVSGAANPF